MTDAQYELEDDLSCFVGGEEDYEEEEELPEEEEDYDN